jgi:ketosteroid isomerase-like protein
MNLQQLADIEACRALIVEFATRIDDGRAHTLGDLMTHDASFARPTVPDVVLQGREAILAAFATRPKHLVSQHLNLNIRIQITGPDSAEGHSVVMLFLANANDELVPGKGRKAGAPIVGTWTDTFVRTAEGWRFKDRRGMATMHTG